MQTDTKTNILEDSIVDEVTFSTLAEKMLSGILIVSKNEIHYINKAFEKITGFSQEDVQRMAPWDMVHEDERENIRELGLLRFEKGARIQDYYEAQWVHKRGHTIWVEVRSVLLKNTRPQKILANIVDITDRKKAQLALEKKKEELRLQAINLEETNTALKVILKQRHKESELLERNIQFNFENLVVPYLNELMSTQTSPGCRQCQSCLKIIKENLKEITAPHIRKYASQYEKLSPKQIQVINLIRQGKTSQEIADILMVSKAAVDFHRNNIRKKLRLKNKKVNLKTFLDMHKPFDPVQGS